MPETNLQPRPSEPLQHRLETLLLQVQAKLDEISARLTDVVAEVQALRQWLEARP